MSISKKRIFRVNRFLCCYNDHMNRKSWFALIIIGLSGQIAWTIENMYFNTFMYHTITSDPSYIAAMVSASAVTATLTTLIMGALSDRIGKRKVFITFGYLIWSLTVLAFGFIKPSTATSVAGAAALVVVMDCIMTFFGSTANDAAFNAYITESVEKKDRTKVEAVVQVLPMISMLFVFGVMDGFTQRGEWTLFFTITAAIMFVSGILAFFLLGKDRGEKRDDVKLLDSLLFGFRKNTVQNNGNLYISLAAYAVNALAMQVFFPYLIIYMQTYLGFADTYVIILAVALVIASAVCVAGGKAVDRIGRIKSSIPMVALMTLGLVMMAVARSFVFTIIAGTVMMSGYLLSTSIFSSMVRDYTPHGNEGEIQGIRMIFQVMLPMIIGPYIGALAIKGSNLTYVELGVEKTVPTPLIFILAAAIEVFTVIPVLMLRKRTEDL